MGTKHNLKHSIHKILRYNHDGSHNTRAARKKRLMLMAEQIVGMGYHIRDIGQLKPNYVTALVKFWLQQGLSAGTIKNRMTDLRWIAGKVNKAHLIPKNNDDLNIPRRQYITNVDKSITLNEGNLSKISDPNIKMSLLLQREFGLRREEALKIKLHEALVGDELRLKKSWCKGGRPRSIKIRYPEQWAVIDQVKQYLVNQKRALIPDNKTYVQQQKSYDQQTHRAGISKAHGLRHAYAQKRYFDITGWPCPTKGGPTHKELTDAQKAIDKAARLEITSDLGHNREDVVGVYCGK